MIINLYNCAIITNDGLYRCETITLDQAKELVYVLVTSLRLIF